MEQTTLIIIAIVFLLVCSSSSIGAFFMLSSETAAPVQEAESNTESKTEPKIEPTPVALPALKIFKRSGESDSGCCGGGGGEPHDLFCPEGSFVKEFYGGSGAVIDRIGIKCSDGSDLGTKGGGGGGPFSVISDVGFNKLHVKSGSLVDNIKFFANDQEKGAYGGGGGGGPNDLNCPDGKIMGLKLRTGGLVDRIQVICGKDQ